MTYLSWAALYEGASDQAYFEILLPRLMNTLIIERGRRPATIPDLPSIVFRRNGVDQVAKAACNSRDAFHLIFIDADTGGRGQEEGLQHRATAYCEAMRRVCDWNPRRCISILPKHETEAWLLCDYEAILGALGFSGRPETVGLPTTPRAAERLVDPKAVLSQAIDQIRGRRRGGSNATLLYPAIAQRQNLQKLVQSDSFSDFQSRLMDALEDLGFL